MKKLTLILAITLTLAATLAACTSQKTHAANETIGECVSSECFELEEGLSLNISDSSGAPKCWNESEACIDAWLEHADKYNTGYYGPSY